MKNDSLETEEEQNGKYISIIELFIKINFDDNFKAILGPFLYRFSLLT